jgi:germination protein M
VTTTVRATRTPLAILVLVILALAGSACTSGAGPLGTPSTPAPTADASVPIPSIDATPGSPAPSSGLASPQPSGADGTAPATVPPSTPTPVPSATPVATGTSVVRAYFFLGSLTGSGGLVPVLREVPRTEAVATAAMRALLAGPSPAEMAAKPAVSTTIPHGTQILGLKVGGGVATVNLSREFLSDLVRPTVEQRLAQVVYTLTQFETVSSVHFLIEGSDSYSFGYFALGSDPGRVNFTGLDVLPAIFVDLPAWGAAAGNPVTVNGIANAFEATFRVQLLSATRGLLVDRPVMASCGTGCWGDFSATIPYQVTEAQWGTLRVFDPSAKDGSQQDVIEYPVWLTPAG